MRSGILYFNRPLFHKNWARFWPVWALYGVIWLFLMPINLMMRGSRSRLTPADTADIASLASPGVVLAFCFGALCAMAVFHYLYQNRSACMMHSLPMDRGTLFFTNWWSGLTFLLGPNLCVFLITLAVEAMYGRVNFLSLWTWLCAQSAVCLFFFSFASFCAMFTGHILALPAFYGILNFLAVGVNSLLIFVMSGYLYGMSDVAIPSQAVEWCTPMAKLYEACIATAYAIGDSGRAARVIREPGVVAVYAAAGLALTVAALMEYQRRQVESAGDVVSEPWMRPVFKYGFAVCAGLAFGTGCALILGFYVDDKGPLTFLVLLWAVIGYFVAEMLLKKSFRVLGSWRGAVALAVVLALGMAALAFDLLGFERRVPQAAGVRSVTMHGNFGGYPRDEGSYTSAITLTDPAQIEEVVALHQAVVDDRERARDGLTTGDDHIWVELDYTLSSGATLRRTYNWAPILASEAQTPGSVAYAAQALLDDRALVRMMYGLDDYGQSRVVDAFVENANSFRDHEGVRDNTVYLTAYAPALWEAVRQDFAQGTIGVRYLFDDEARKANTCPADLFFMFATEEERPASEGPRSATESLTITLTPNARHVRQVLEQAGALEEYPMLLTPWSELENEE